MSSTPMRLYRRFFGTIRNKIVFPFLFLTLVVAMGGSFVVMRLVAASVQDRLTNQLIDTSQAASDSIVGQEQAQLDALRLVVFTVGVPEALIARDAEALTGYMSTLASNQNVEMLIALDSAGVVITDVRRSDDGGYLSGQPPFG